MSTRTIMTALGAAALLVGAPTYALAAGPGDRPDEPGKQVHECEDGVDNDGDGATDTADGDCGSPRDNSERPDDAEEPDGEEPPAGGPTGTPLDQVIGMLPELPAPPAP